jgi:hypothetical protein
MSDIEGKAAREAVNKCGAAEGDNGVTFEAQRAGANGCQFRDLMKGALKP